MKIKLYSDYLEKEIELDGEILKRELLSEGESESRHHLSNGLFSTKKYWYENYKIKFQTKDNKIVHFEQKIRTWQKTKKEFLNQYSSKTVLIEKNNKELYVEEILIELGLFSI